MPVYTFRNTETKEQFDKAMKYEDKEKFLAENPLLEQIFTSMPPLGDSVRLRLRTTDDGFKEVLHKIGSAHYGSDLIKNNLSRN